MKVRELITKLGFRVDQSKIAAFDASIGKAKMQVRGLTQNMKELSSSVRNFGLKMTAFVSVPLALLGIKSLKTASELEQLNVSFTTMLGSAEKADVLIKDLLTFAAKTPFQIKDVQKNAKQLLAMGIANEKIIPTLKALGDISAGLSVPMERLALNFGQVKTQGKLTGRELRDFSVAGVPLVDELSKVLGINKKQVAGWVSAGKVGFKDVEKAFMNMTGPGGTFFDLMIKQSGTLAGKWSNLLDVWDITTATFGDMLAEELGLKKFLTGLTEWLGDLQDTIKKLPKPLRVVVVGLFSFLIVIGPIITILGQLGLALIGSIAGFFALKIALVALLPILKSVTGIFSLMGLKLLLITGLILLLVAAFTIFIQDVHTWVNGGDSLIGELLGPWKAYKEGLKSIFTDIKKTLKSFFTGDMNTFQKQMELWSLTLKFFFKDLIKDLAITLGGGFGELLTDLGEKLVLFAESVGESLGELFSNPKQFLKDWVKSIADITGLAGSGITAPSSLKDAFTPLPASANAAFFENNRNSNAGNAPIIKVDSKVNLTLPDTTLEENRRILNNEAKSMVEDAFGQTLANPIFANPVRE